MKTTQAAVTANPLTMNVTRLPAARRSFEDDQRHADEMGGDVALVAVVGGVPGEQALALRIRFLAVDPKSIAAARAAR